MKYHSINCLLCNKEIQFCKGLITFFFDNAGFVRHGTICVDCYWEQKIKEE